MNRIQYVIYVSIIATIAGCASPTRVDVDRFPLISSGRIEIKDIPSFSDCILDGYNPLQGTAFSPRQIRQQRGTISRIETLVAGGSILFVSVDIRDDGRVELFGTTEVPKVIKRPEYDVFTLCLKRYELK